MTTEQEQEHAIQQEMHNASKRMKQLLIRIRNTGRIEGIGSEFLYAAYREGWVEHGANGRVYLTVSGRRQSGR